VLIQQAVAKQWVVDCRAAKIREACIFIAVLLVFSLLSVGRLGFFGEQAVVNGGLQQTFLRTPYGPTSKGGNGDGGCGDNDEDDDGKKIEFRDIRSAGDFLSVVEGIMEKFDARGKGHDPTSPLSLHSSGMVIGAPVFKQWRAKVSSSLEGCVLSSKLKRAPTCFTPGEFEVDATLPILEVGPSSLFSTSSSSSSFAKHKLPPLRQPLLLKEASTARHLSGDLALPSGASKTSQKLPPIAYSVVLPVAAAGQQQQACDLDLDNEAVSAAKEEEESCPLHTSEESLALIRALSSSETMQGWIDNRTRALAFEVALYSPDWDRLTLVQLVAEFPPGAGVRANPRIRTFKINTWNFRSNLPHWLMALECAMVCLAIPLVVLIDIYKSKPKLTIPLFHLWQKKLNWSTSGLIALAVNLSCLFYCFHVARLEKRIYDQVESMTWDNTGSYQSMHTLTSHIDSQVSHLFFNGIL
jgi:hypothetical protein